MYYNTNDYDYESDQDELGFYDDPYNYGCGYESYDGSYDNEYGQGYEDSRGFDFDGDAEASLYMSYDIEDYIARVEWEQMNYSFGL